MYQIEQEQQCISAETGIPPPEVQMYIRSGHDQRRYNEPTDDEVAAIFTSNDGAPPVECEITVHSRNENEGPSNLSHFSACADPMTYPIFFPYGGFQKFVKKCSRGRSNFK